MALDKERMKNNCETDKADAECESAEQEIQDEQQTQSKADSVPDSVMQALIEAEKKAAEAEQKKSEYYNGLLRLQAEFDNYRKRTRAELECAFDVGFADALKTFLPLMDNLERAIESARNKNCDDIADGIQMCYDKFFEELSKKGLKEIKALGEAFDPNRHNAFMRVETDDCEKSGTVCEVIEKGYEYNGNVIRHSLVKVYQ